MSGFHIVAVNTRFSRCYGKSFWESIKSFDVISKTCIISERLRWKIWLNHAIIPYDEYHNFQFLSINFWLFYFFIHFRVLWWYGGIKILDPNWIWEWSRKKPQVATGQLKSQGFRLKLPLFLHPTLGRGARIILWRSDVYPVWCLLVSGGGQSRARGNNNQYCNIAISLSTIRSYFYYVFISCI